MKSILEKYGIVFNAEGGSGGGDGGAPEAAPAASTTLLGSDLPKAPETPTMADHIYGEDGVRVGSGEGEADDKGGDDKAKEGEADDGKKDDGDKSAKTDDDKKDDKKDGEEDDDKKKDGDDKDAIKPEDYDLAPPEGFQLDSEVESEFRKFAAERNWSKDDVSALKDMQVKLYEKQIAAHAETVAKWGEDLKADKEIGGTEYDENAGRAVQAMHEFFSPEARDLMDKTGMGNHPEIVKGFVRIGKLFGEGGTVSGLGGNRATIVDAMYGDK